MFCNTFKISTQGVSTGRERAGERPFCVAVSGVTDVADLPDVQRWLHLSKGASTPVRRRR